MQINYRYIVVEQSRPAEKGALHHSENSVIQQFLKYFKKLKKVLAF